MAQAIHMTARNHFSTTLRTLAIAAVLATPALAAAQGEMAIPDFTKGEKIPASATHDWNLGATGPDLLR